MQVALKEGFPVRDRTFVGNYRYYSFSLASKEDIEQIDFFLTIMTGDVILIWSKTEKYPTYEDIDKQKAFTNETDSIILDKENIYEGIYYLSVYAFEVSEYTIGLAIERSEGRAIKITELKL